MQHLWGVGSRGVWGGDFLDVRVRFGAFLDAEGLVEGAPQLQRRERETTVVLTLHSAMRAAREKEVLGLVIWHMLSIKVIV